jgi:hypothetical protein
MCPYPACSAASEIFTHLRRRLVTVWKVDPRLIEEIIPDSVTRQYMALGICARPQAPGA